MRFKGTIFLTLVLVILGGYLLWVELPGEGKRSERDVRSKRVLDIQPDRVTGFVIQFGKREIELERHPQDPDQEWEVIRPIVGPANDGVARSALSAVANLKYSRIVEEKPEDLKPYGLDSPELSVTIVLNRTEVEQLNFGDNNPIGREIYVRRRGDKRVFLVNSGIRFTFEKELKDWRRKKIFPLRPGLIKGFSLHYSDRTLELAKEEEKWWIKKPQELPGDRGAIVGFLNALVTLQAEDFFDTDIRKKKNSFGEPFLGVTLKVLEAKREIFFYRPPSEPGTTYAFTNLMEPLYKLRPLGLDFLQKNLFDFRNKDVIRLVDQGEVAEIEVVGEGRGYTLIRKEGVWTVDDGQKADSSMVLHLLAELQVTEVEEFLEGLPSEKGGFDPPQLRIVLRDKEKKELGVLSLGQEDKDKVYGKSTAQPSPFLVRKGLLEAIPLKKDLGIKKAGSG